jgi:hypothetical protein
VSVVQQGEWKLLEFLEDGRLELYHLGDDLGETRNLAEEQPERTRELKARLEAWRRSINAPMPQANPEQEPADANERAETMPAATPQTAAARKTGGNRDDTPTNPRRGTRRARQQKANAAKPR